MARARGPSRPLKNGLLANSRSELLRGEAGEAGEGERGSPYKTSGKQAVEVNDFRSLRGTARSETDNVLERRSPTKKSTRFAHQDLRTLFNSLLAKEP